MSAHSKLDLPAVRAALAAHVTIAATAKALRVHERTLRRWLVEYAPELGAARQRGLRSASRDLQPKKKRKTP